MKKRKLEILLERVEDIKEPNVTLEQYSTPAAVASDLLYFAYMNGDIENCIVYDLGCGNGILGIGAKLLGAKEVVGIERDEKSIEVARENSKRSGVEVEFRLSDVREVEGTGDTVVMNPPFGAQWGNKHADRIFLEKAFEIAAVVYSIHNIGSDLFIKKSPPKKIITHHFTVPFQIKRRFWFHEKEKKFIRAEIYRMERC